MQCAFYDKDEFFDEDEFEPRITPKPMTKLDCFAVPTVPEVSLIFEKPITKNLNGSINSSPASLAKPTQPIDKSPFTAKNVNYTSPNIDSRNSYAAWREQNYPREINSTNTTHISPKYKDSRNCVRASQSDVQDVSMQQEQDRICDTRNRLINANPDNGMLREKSVKFNTNNSYNLERENQLSSNKRQLSSCNSLQTATCAVTDRTTRVPNNIIADASNKDEHLQIPYARYPYPFQQFHAPNYSNRDIDNNETVKTLLQLVNNQSEQIKTLQLQIDRLVRMQEESFRNKTTCTCLSSHANQMFGYPTINCYDAASTLGSSHAQSYNQGVKKNGGQSVPVTEKKDLQEKLASLGEDKDCNKLEALLEQQSKKTFVEQKVSIGVMTSFEFTVQNSPFLMDSETHDKMETYGEGSSVNRRNAVNINNDTTEPVNRYKNTLTRKPGAAQLENIVEDTESYLSSSQQQSSNFNASSSVRDSERHTPKQPDLYNTINISESPKMYQRFDDINKKKLHEGIYIDNKSGDMDERAQDTRKVSNASMNVDCGFTRSANCRKAFVSDANDNAVIDGRESDDKINTSRRPLHNVHLPVNNYYQDHRNREHNTVKQAKDIDDSMTLSGGDLKIFERTPSPEPSIHVEMQDYTSDDESDKPKRTSKIGWTFYNNILGQVNEILQNSGVIDDTNQNDAKVTRKVEQENDTVKAATLEQLRRLGISLTENDEHRESNDNNKTNFDSSFYPRLDHPANTMMQSTSVVNETNTSMHMRALALKYLSDEQLAEIALHKQGSSSLKHLMLSNMQGTNMSFATMRYLERYQLLPGRNNIQTKDTDKMCDEMISKPAHEKNNPALQRFPFVQTPGTTCPSRILDISTLKRQPKLL